MYPFILRFIITVIILFIIYIMYYDNIDVLTLTIFTFIFDTIDCGIYNKLINKFDCNTHYYQRNDKLLDIITYWSLLLLFRKKFTYNTYILLLLLTVYRTIGVYKYYNNNDNTIIHKYFDGINITLLIYYLSTKSQIINDNYIISLILGLLFKLKYERVHHHISKIRN